MTLTCKKMNFELKKIVSLEVSLVFVLFLFLPSHFSSSFHSWHYTTMSISKYDFNEMKIKTKKKKKSNFFLPYRQKRNVLNFKYFVALLLRHSSSPSLMWIGFNLVVMNFLFFSSLRLSNTGKGTGSETGRFLRRDEKRERERG